MASQVTSPTTKDWTLFREADAEGHNSIHGKLDEMKSVVLTGHYGGLVEWIDQRGSSDWEASPVNKNADPHSPDVLVQSIKKHSHSISGWRPNIWVAPGAKISLIEEKIKEGFNVVYGKKDREKKTERMKKSQKKMITPPTSYNEANDPDNLINQVWKHVEQLKEANKILREKEDAYEAYIKKQQAKIKELETTIKTLQHGLDIKGLEKDIDPMMICPITHEIMRDPVSDNEGNNYERSAITEWITRGNKTHLLQDNLYF